MAKKRSYKRKVKKHLRKAPIIVTLLIILAAIGLLLLRYGDKLFGDESVTEPTTESVSTPAVDVTEGEVSYHIIDVGQGDAILIMTDEGNMLIDSGDLSSQSRKALTSYLGKYGITAFEYVVFTHTDADHIGSGDHIIENYDIKTVIMPDYTTSTNVFGRLVDAIEKKNVELILIGEDKDACEQSGYSFKLGQMQNTIIAPTEDFSDPNNMSVVIKSVFGETSVLLTGDAEKKSEEKMLAEYKKGELDCDILKVGHHGASTSTTQAFFEAVSPFDVLISCGTDNKYGHPHKETMDKFGEVNVFRTDTDGSIIVTTDGKTYSIKTEKGK